MLGNDHSPLELWKTLPQTKKDFSTGKTRSSVLCLLTLSAQALLTESCLLRCWAPGQGFSTSHHSSQSLQALSSSGPSCPRIPLGSHSSNSPWGCQTLKCFLRRQSQHAFIGTGLRNHLVILTESPVCGDTDTSQDRKALLKVTCRAGGGEEC